MPRKRIRDNSPQNQAINEQEEFTTTTVESQPDPVEQKAFELTVGQYNETTRQFECSQLLDSLMNKIRKTMPNNTAVGDPLSIVKSSRDLKNEVESEISIFEKIYKNSIAITKSDEESFVLATQERNTPLLDFIIETLSNSMNSANANIIKISSYLGSHKNRYLQNVYFHLLLNRKDVVPIYINCAQCEYDADFEKRVISSIHEIINNRNQTATLIFIFDSVRDLSDNLSVRSFYRELLNVWAFFANNNIKCIVGMDMLEKNIAIDSDVRDIENGDFSVEIQVNRLSVTEENEDCIESFKTNCIELCRNQIPFNPRQNYSLLGICQRLNLRYIDIYLAKAIHKSVIHGSFDKDVFYRNIENPLNIQLNEENLNSFRKIAFNYYYQNNQLNNQNMNIIYSDEKYKWAQFVFDHEMIIAYHAAQHCISHLRQTAQAYRDGVVFWEEFTEDSKALLKGFGSFNDQDPLYGLYCVLSNLFNPTSENQ